MLRHTSEIGGYAIGATDGPIGSITDFLFDDVTWRVRWLVVDTGAFLSGRKGACAAVGLDSRQSHRPPALRQSDETTGQGRPKHLRR
jgi:hypothetical protein